MSNQQPPPGAPPPSVTSATPLLTPEQSQPVDLATSSKGPQPLRIPTVPRPQLASPSRSGPTGAVTILGNTATSATPIRAGPVSNRPLLAVPKAGSGAATGSGSVNLAVMNKVTVLTTSNPPNKATPLTGGNVPRATATTIVRPPTSYPLTLKSPGSGATPLVSGVANTTSIRLTTGTPSQPSSIQLVPMSTLPASIRPQNNPVRPSIPSARGPTSFRPAATISDAVTIRTLVQSPGSGKPMNTGPAGMASITTTSTGTGFYKQVTITPPNSQKPINPGVATTTMRIPATSKMTVLPTPGSASPFQTVSLATTSQQINVPLAPGARAITAGKLISVTGSTSSPPGVPPISTGGGVTIHKSTIPVSSQSPRTISLPYGAPAQVTSLPKPVSQAIPVARVCPQQNVVTITTTVGNPIGSSATSGVLIPRSGTSGNPGQAVAINLSSNQTLNLTKSQQPMAPGAKITSITGNPSGGARLVSLPAQPVLEASSSPSRPSILRRREGDREPSMPETPPPRPDSRNDDAGSSSSGSTTLSATSSPGLGGTDRANLSGSEDPQPPVIQPSPSRKKPRKQTLTSTRPGSEWGENNHHSEPSEELKRKTPGKSGQTVSPLKTSNANYIRDKPHMSLLNSYRHTWKSRHNHFLRHSDVRPRGDANPTVNEVANQKHIMQKINGWKIYHLTSQMEDIIDMEAELTSRLSHLQKKLDKHSMNEVSKDVGKIQELIKANLQRSKVIQDQVKESKDHALELFDHKSRVSDILHKYMSKRSVKKRDVKMHN